MDYIKSEAERLPNGTATRALAAMNGSVGPRWMDDPELPSQILSTPAVSPPDTPPSVTELDSDARFVTITISRADAKLFLVVAPLSHRWTVMGRMVDAVQAALEADNA
jgi:hypothetical protein